MTLQEPGRQPDPFRVGRVIVHDDVPVLALERPQVSIAIALEAEDLGREICVAAPAREDRHAVAAPDGMAYQMRPDETRPAEHEHAQLRAGTRRPRSDIRRLRLGPVASSNERPAGDGRSLQKLTTGAG